MASQLVARNALAAAGGLGAGVSTLGAGAGAGTAVAGAGGGRGKTAEYHEGQAMHYARQYITPKVIINGRVDENVLVAV